MPKPMFLEDQGLLRLSVGGDPLSRFREASSSPPNLKAWEELNRTDWLAGFEDGNYRRCIVQADAGLGKSVNLSWLATELAKQRHFLPFRLRVSHLPPSHTDLFSTLRELWRKAAGGLTGFDKAVQDTLEKYRDSGRLALLLDGLDEDAEDGSAERTLGELLERDEWYRCPIVVCTRSYTLPTRERLFRPSDVPWQFVRIDYLTEQQQRRFLGDLNGEPRYELIDPAARRLLGVPRVCETFRELDRREDFDGLKTVADVYWKATTEMLWKGISGTGDNRLGWSGTGPVPSVFHPVQRDIAFYTLAAAAFQMFVNPDRHGRPGEPEFGLVPEARSGAFFLDVYGRLLTARAHLEKTARRQEAVLLGPLEPEHFFRTLGAVFKTNTGALESYLFDAGSRGHRLRWHDRTMQTFFAAAWACRFAPPDDLTACRRWVIDPQRETGYEEFWQFVCDLPDAAVHLPTWVDLVGPLYSARDADNNPTRFSRWIYSSWDRMRGERPRVAFGREFQEFRRKKNPVALKLHRGFRPVQPALNGRPASPDKLRIWCVANDEYELFDPGHRRRRWQLHGGHLLVKRTRNPAADDRCPAVNISWYDAWCFTRWLGEVPIGGEPHLVRLPAEGRWEVACAAGMNTNYTFEVGSNDCLPEWCNFDGTAPIAGGARSRSEIPFRGYTLPVDTDQFRPNPWGFYQMHGNVYEWCGDREGGACLRGGCWESTAAECATKHSEPPDEKKQGGHHAGLRLAAVPRSGTEEMIPQRREGPEHRG